MGRAPRCEKEGLNRGRWTSEEDETLIKYIEANGEGSWRSLPKNAGLLRCGKSCRLRWINYLRGDLKRGNITTEEEEIIVKLHASIGNRMKIYDSVEAYLRRREMLIWSVIASQLPGRTDNEIKNYWKSHLRRKIYRFLRAKKNSPQASVDVTNILQMKQRTGRVSRRVAKKYNKNRVVAKIKSPPPSSSNESTKNRLNTETTNDQSIVSNEICLNNNDTAEDHVGGINLILEDIENQEPGPNEIGYQGDELMDIDASFESWSVDSNGLLSLHDQQKIEKIFADLSAECDRKNNKEEEIFNLSASVDVTNTLQMKRRTGRINRSAAKYYIKNRVVAKIKSPPPSTSNESAQNRLNTERTDQSIVSNEICLNNNDAAEGHVGGINLILEDIENQELGPNEIGYQGDELMDIDALFESGSLDSNGLLSLHDQQQIEKIFANLSAECDRKNDKEDEIFSLSASVDVTNILQMKRRTGRTSRSVAKSYNKNMVVAKIKSPPPSTTERTHGQSIVSNEICLNNNDTAEEHVGGINLILEDMENQELRRNEIGYRGDELMDIDAFFESLSMDSNGLLSLHDQQQIEKIFADLSAECDRKNDKEDEILSLSASHSLGFCSYKDHKEIGFDDDMMLW